jgi:hypothetical protein
VKKVLGHICNFLASHDLQSVIRQTSGIDLTAAAKSVYTWLVLVPICIYLLWTKKFKLMIFLASFFLFILLVQKTLTTSGGQVDLHNVLAFVGGTTALVALNLYLLFVRE